MYELWYNTYVLQMAVAVGYCLGFILMIATANFATEDEPGDYRKVIALILMGIFWPIIVLLMFVWSLFNAIMRTGR